MKTVAYWKLCPWEGKSNDSVVAVGFPSTVAFGFGSDTKDGLQKANAENPQGKDKTSEVVKRVEIMQ
jgi:hypothetical protein